MHVVLLSITFQAMTKYFIQTNIYIWMDSMEMRQSNNKLDNVKVANGKENGTSNDWELR